MTNNNKNKITTILGVDPALNNTGWSILKTTGQGDAIFENVGHISNDIKDDYYAKLETIRSNIENTISATANAKLIRANDFFSCISCKPSFISIVELTTVATAHMTLTLYTFEWNIDGETVVSVDESNVLHALKGGKATIENGALLSAENHAWFHQQDRADRERMNQQFQDLKRDIDNGYTDCQVQLVPETDITLPFDLDIMTVNIDDTGKIKPQKKAKKKYKRAKKKRKTKLWP